MNRLVVLTALAAAVVLPVTAFAQAKGGACSFTGSATIKAPIGSVPTLGHPGFTFTGSTAGPACRELSGGVNSSDGKFVGDVGNCGGNSHYGTASTALGPVDYRGGCTGSNCMGVGYNAGGRAFYYDLPFDLDTINRATVQGECRDGKFTKASFSGVAAGGSR